MSIDLPSRKVLWSRAGNECAFPDCNELLTVDLHDASSAALGVIGVALGEEAHIRSGNVAGPRFDSNYPASDVDSYKNLILLCLKHHRRIDKNGGIEWTTEQLISMKQAHELKIRERLKPDELKRRALEERLAAAMGQWEALIGLDDWDGLTSGLNPPIPGISRKRFDGLIAASQWLLAREWPEDWPRLSYAFTNLRLLLNQLIRHINSCTEDGEGERLRIRRDYKRLGDWNPSEYQRMLREFRLNSAVSWHYAIELTLATNLIIASARREFDPLYRFDEGLVLMRDGDGILENRLVRLEYDNVRWEHPPPHHSLEAVRHAIDVAGKANEMNDPTEVNLFSLRLEPDPDSI